MEGLLEEYKQTLEFTREEMRYLKAGSRTVLPDAERALRIRNLKDTTSYWSFLLFAESNLLAAIEYMEEKTKVSDIKKHSVERMTVYVDPDDAVLQSVDEYSHDATLSEADVQDKKFKMRLIREIMKTLTKQQQDILDLYSRGFTHKEISLMLDCTRQNITSTLKTIKKKINDEGWVMV